MKLTPELREILVDKLIDQARTHFDNNNDSLFGVQQVVQSFVDDIELSMTEIKQLGFEFIGTPFNVSIRTQAVEQLTTEIIAEIEG